MPLLFENYFFLTLAVAPFIGSFLATVAVRLPSRGNPLKGRSACPDCRHRLAAIDLMPLLSWLLSGGRCRYCGAAVSPIYPGLEIASILIVLWAATVVEGPLLPASAALGWSLLVLAVIDWRHFILPDSITLPLLAAGLLAAYFLLSGRIGDHAIGAAAGFFAFAAIAWLYRRLRGRPGLGLGDAKLLAVAGAWLTWQGLPSVVLLGSTSALVLVMLRAMRGPRPDMTQPIPFGPHLCLGIWLVWLYGPVVAV